MRKVTGHFECDGAAVNIDVGFVPDTVKLIIDDGTNQNIITWFRGMYDDLATKLYGFLLTGSTGVTTQITAAANGISPFDTKYNQVLVDSPVPGKGLVKADVSDWAAATDYSSGERSATTVGTIVRPPTHNGCVYELTTDTGSGTSEPSSWPTTPGTTCTDGGSNVWTCRQENVVTGGKQGFTVGASAGVTNGYEAWFEAERSDKDSDRGDSAAVGANSVL